VHRIAVGRHTRRAATSLACGTHHAHIDRDLDCDVDDIGRRRIVDIERWSSVEGIERDIGRSVGRNRNKRGMIERARGAEHDEREKKASHAV
jgi:hypothetical protein